MNEIEKRKETLPEKPEELNKYIRIGEQKLIAYEAKLKAMEAVDYDRDVRRKVFEETFDFAVGLLVAEAKLGELLGPLSDPTASRKGRRQLPEGITHKRSHQAQLINKYLWLLEKIASKTELIEDIPRRSMMLKVIEELRRGEERKGKEWLNIYNIWNIGKKDLDDVDYFGVFPRAFMENLIYYHTKENDLVFDPFAGSGITVDICRARGRRFYCSDMVVYPGRESDIKQWKIQDGIPPDLEKPDLVFLDPPYWKQAENKYSDLPDDLANISLEQYYEIFNKFLQLLIKWEVKRIAIVIAPTQYPNENHEFEDHIFRFHEMLNKKHSIEMRYILPYSSEQYNGNQVNIMKEEKKALNLIRDLVIWAFQTD